MATQDEQKGRWKTAGGNANPRMRQEAVRGLRFPRLQGIWQRRDTGCDLAGFLIIFITLQPHEEQPSKRSDVSQGARQKVGASRRTPPSSS